MRTPRLLLVGCIVFISAVTFFLLNSSGVNSVAANQGKWEIACMPDWKQPLDTTVPVFVFRVTSGVEKDETGTNEYRISSVIVDNRSMKSVSSITLRWTITPMDDRANVLKTGKLDPHILATLHKTLAGGQRQTLKLSDLKPGKLVLQVPDANSRTGFTVMISVGEVIFDDGSIWKEEMTDVTNKSAAEK